jgi:hypothetical protein
MFANGIFSRCLTNQTYKTIEALSCCRIPPRYRHVYDLARPISCLLSLRNEIGTG